MAKTIEPISNLNIDGEVLEVATLSEAVQQMVEIFNGWNQEEADASDKLMMVKAAKADLSRQIIMQVRKDQEEASAAEAPAEEAAEAPAGE